MKYLKIVVLSCLLNSCDYSSEEAVTVTVPATSQQSESETGSFRIVNQEIMEDILAKLAENDIEYWLNDDGSIGFQLIDAEQVDSIFYMAVGEYAARN